MKYLKPALAIGFVIGALVCANAWARPGHGYHGGHGGYGGHVVVRPGGPGYYHHGHGYGRGVVVGLALGAPLFWPGYGYGYGDPFYDPYYGRYYFSRPAYLPPLEPGAPPVSWYCRNPAGYYPQVTECLVPWRAVVP
jgi:hypothetical protein